MQHDIVSPNKSQKCLVSIVTIVFNGEDYIEQTVSSVLKQDYQEIEYIVVDGGSSDETLSKISKFSGRIHKVISEPDNGIYYAINKGISLATGSLIGLIHCGDYYEPTAVSAAVETYLHTGAALIYGDMKIIEGEGPGTLVRIVRGDHRYLRRYMSISHPATFISKECYLAYGIYDTQYKSVADYDLILMLFLSGVKFRHVDKVFANFRNGGISGSNLVISLKEHFGIRRKRLGMLNALYYVLLRGCAHSYLVSRKYILEAIIGKENYIKLKKYKQLYDCR